jgi:uncharacterized protein (TIRG00374 family)
LKRLFSILLAVVVTAGALAFALWDADLGLLWQTLIAGRHWVLLPFLAVLAVFYLANAVRWGLLLRPFGRFGVRELLPSMMIGFAANNVLPLRVGELIRVYLFARDSGQPRSGVLMTLVLERLLDLIAILCIFAAGLALLPEAPPAMRKGMWLAAAAVAGITVALGAFSWRPERLERIWARVAARAPQAVRARGSAYLAQFAKALAPALRPGTLAAMLAQSAARWLLAALLAWLCVFAYGDPISPALSMLVIGVVALAVSLPSVPGFVGPIQAAFVFALAPFGIPQETALAASILFLLGHWVPVTLTGTLLIAARHLSFTRLERAVSASD